MTRALRPRATAALAVAPATVTDRTAPLVLGLEPRAFRELVIDHHVRHARVGRGVGRRIIARLEDVLAVLDRLADDAAPAEDAPAPEEPSATSSDGVDGVLAMIGRRRRTG